MRYILWLSIAITTGFYICGPIQDPDLWWHIVVGRWILSHGSLPHVDYWNMFGVGQPWRAYSWSNEIVYALVEGWYSIKGLLILKLILVSALSLSLFYCLSKVAKDWIFGSALAVLSVAACFSHFTLRPQSLVWVFFTWLIYYADLYKNDRKKIWPILLLLVLWANTHVTTIIGIAACVMWQIKNKDDFKFAARLGIFCFLATLITPYMGGEWAAFFAQAGHPLKYSTIAEFRAATVMDYAAGFLLLISGLLLFFVHLQPKALSFAKLLSAAVLCFGAFAVIKFIPFAVIFCAFCVAKIWATSKSDLGNLATAINKFSESFEKIPREGLSFVMICLAIINVHKLWQEPINLDVVPKLAVDFIQNNNLPLPILNLFGDGGYLIYRYADANGEPTRGFLASIDGRTNVGDPEVFKKHSQAGRGLTNWAEYLDVVKPQTIIWRNEGPLVAILQQKPEWCQVYEQGLPDRGYSIFIKREAFDLSKELKLKVISKSLCRNLDD